MRFLQLSMLILLPLVLLLQLVCSESSTNQYKNTHGGFESKRTGSNGKIFREYIGASGNGLKITDVPIHNGIEVHLILSFAIDYTNDDSPRPTNGKFGAFWDGIISPSSIRALKAAHSNVKVIASLGGDSIGGNRKVVFNPRSVSSWVTNAVSSLTSLAEQYSLDGIDIDYEHFSASPKDFASCIGKLITGLKKKGVISIASIAPYDDLQTYYGALWVKFRGVIDYVNFQFYTYSSHTTVPQFLSFFDRASSVYAGGKVLASFSTDPESFDPESGGITPETGFFTACKQLQARRKLFGIFIWSADNSFASNVGFKFEFEAQALLAANS